MEIFLVVTLILIFVFLNSLTYLTGVLATPKDAFFLGTVHWPGDYFYYLSQFAQGKESWLMSFDLFTSDFQTKTLVGWVNVFLGRIFYLTGINHFLAYQLSIVIFTASFLLLSYLFVREVFAEDREDRGDEGAGKKRIIAFVLFVISNAFPRVVNEGGRLSLSYYDFWFNNGLPFNRLGGVPHHLIARTSILASLLLAIRWWRGNKGGGKIKWGALAGLFLVGFILASIDPVHWILTVIVLFISLAISIKKITPFFGFLKEKLSRSPKGKLSTFNLSFLIPSFVFFLSGLPMVFYLKRLFSKPPYVQLVSWEASQQLAVSFWFFVLGNGPVMVLAILGLVFFVNKATLAKVLALVFSFLTLALFFSPIPQKLAIVNVRFLPATTTLFFACFAAEAIGQLGKKLGKKKNLVSLIAVGTILFMVAPSFFLQIKDRMKVDTTNAFFYLPNKFYAAYNFAQKNSSPLDNFLVIWPFNWSFPAVTGRRVFVGHNLLTINYGEKTKKANGFFSNKMKIEEMEKLLVREKIDYILAYSWLENISKLKNLKKIFDNGYAVIYKVSLPQLKAGGFYL